MNPNKVEEGLFHHHLDPLNGLHHHLTDESHPLILDHDDHRLNEDSLNLSEFVLFNEDDEDDSASRTSSDADGPPPSSSTAVGQSQQPQPPNVVVCQEGSNSNPRFQCINPEPHISTQFYTFNQESHALMIRCILESRLATPDEIRVATPTAVLASWRSVWKDRNEDTAYLTAWKRIQDKLNIHVGEHGNQFLCFKNNSNNQFVSHVNQWQEIVMNSHGDADFKHLGLKETIEKIKQVWTVGAKFYGIPESFIRNCVASCPICSDSSSGGSATRSKRRRFEYTESCDVPAKEVPTKLQELAAKHKVVLCIRQKYIRYKPFMAEVKDYACHRAGEPTSSSYSASAAKKSRVLKREHYASKRCGCGFRIRAIVPITNYNEKEKTFVYQEEGIAVFKLYAVHSGHEPGPLDGNARIMHRIVGHKGGILTDQDIVYGMSDEVENEGLGFMEKDDGDLQHSVLQQVKELRNEVGLLEGRIGKIPPELLGSVSQELFDILNKVRGIGDCGSHSNGLLSDKMQSDDVFVDESDLPDWSGKHTVLIDDDDDEESFERTLGDVASWDRQIRAADCLSEKDLVAETCKPEKWLKNGELDEKRILNCVDSKVIKPLRDDEPIETDVVSLGGIQVDSFSPDNPKWYDSPCGLDSGTDSGFRHGEIV